MIKAVLFDLFETLITERNRTIIPGSVVAERLGLDERASTAQWRARMQARMIGTFPDYASVLVDICSALGAPANMEAIRRLQEERVASHAELFYNLDPNVLDMLEKIRAMGIKTGLVSNASCEEITAWEDSPLSKLIDAAVFSCEVGFTKPGPEIYLTACEQLGVDPRECIYVGDGGSNELPGAAALGMKIRRATWFTDQFPEEYRINHDQKWDVNYPKLRTPAELLEEIRNRGMNTLVTATQHLSQPCEPLPVKDCRVRHEGKENGKKRHFRMRRENS